MKRRVLRGIKVQMLFVTFIIVIILSAGILTSVGIVLSKEYDKEINFNNETVTKLIASNLENFLGKAYSITEELALNSDIQSMNKELQEPIFKNCAERNTFIDLLFAQGNDGMQTGRSSGEYGDRSQRWWFQMVHKDGKKFISKSYFSASIGAPVSTVFVPIKKDNTIIGSIGMDMKLDYIQQLISENSDEERGRYSFVIDGEGSIIAHPNSDYITQMYNYKTLTRQVQETDTEGKAAFNEDGSNKTVEESIEISDGYQQVIRNVMSNQEGSLYFKDGENAYYSSYSPIELQGDSDHWSIVTIQEEGEAKAIIRDIIKTSVTAGLILLIISMVFMILFANSIANPIIKISKLLSKTASGDFTVRFHTKSKSEIGLLANSFNEMSSKVSSLLSNAKNTTTNINESLSSLNEKSEISKKVAEEVKTSVDEILKGSTEQAMDAEASASISNSLNEEFVLLSDKTETMIKEAEQASKVTTLGSDKVIELKEKNYTTYHIIEKTSSVIENLNKESKTIGGILNTLEDISEQTGLLSLNASIEAARAGEQGKGFAVVAEEIQKLSVASANATSHISDIIIEIQAEIASSVEMMEKMKSVSKEQNEAVQNVNQSFEQITSVTRNIITFIEEIGVFVQKMQEDNNRVVTSIENIASISEETAACTETVTISIAGQTAEIQQIAMHTAELKEKADFLEKEISKFKIENTKE